MRCGKRLFLQLSSKNAGVGGSKACSEATFATNEIRGRKVNWKPFPCVLAYIGVVQAMLIMTTLRWRESPTTPHSWLMPAFETVRDSIFQRNGPCSRLVRRDFHLILQKLLASTYVCTRQRCDIGNCIKHIFTLHFQVRSSYSCPIWFQKYSASRSKCRFEPTFKHGFIFINSFCQNRKR